jgi:nitroreductase
MEVLEAIRTRRSIRQFTSEPVSEETIRELLTAAMYAPSAGNQQPWHFVVITERKLLDAIPTFHPYAEMLKQAPVAIVVCGEPALEKYRGRWMLDCSAATQNILLAAHAKGLGTVWVGIYPERERMEGMQRLLNLPEQILPMALVPMGFPAERVPQPKRFNPTRIHHNHW